jgi:sugar phosphate isomerase/epimerase
MKLSIAIADKDAPPDAFVVWRGFGENIARAAEYGYDGVELALRDASQIDAKKLDGWLAKAGIAVSAITTGQVFAVSNLYFTHRDAAVRNKAAQTFMGLIDIAADFAPLVNIGRARGFIEAGGNIGDTRSLFYQSITPVLEYAYKKGVTLIIEPVNRYEINFINSVDDCISLLDMAEFDSRIRQNIGIMPDTFHMNIEDASMGDALIKAIFQVKYVHLADSNRMAPGCGHINFDEIFSALSAIGYDGWASVEILPIPSPNEAAKSAAEFLLPKIKTYKPLIPEIMP